MRFQKLMKRYTKELQDKLKRDNLDVRIKYKDKAIYEHKLMGVGEKLIEIHYDKNEDNKHLEFDVQNERLVPHVREITQTFMNELLFYKPNVLVRS